MTQAVDPYFDYLCSLAHAGCGPGNATFYILCRILYQKEFFPILEQDSARGTDGEDIRLQWAPTEEELESVDRGPCNMLEMLLGLSERINYYQEDIGEELEAWPGFYRLLANLGLDKYTDQFILGPECGGDYEKDIRQILNRALERTYSRDGSGGFFPIPGSSRDQRNVPIWHQMQEWMLGCM